MWTSNKEATNQEVRGSGTLHCISEVHTGFRKCFNVEMKQQTKYCMATDWLYVSTP